MHLSISAGKSLAMYRKFLKKPGNTYRIFPKMDDSMGEHHTGQKPLLSGADPESYLNLYWVAQILSPT